MLDPESQLALDRFSILRLKEDEAVVSVKVEHGINEEAWEQVKFPPPPTPQDHAMFAALVELWRFHRTEGGWDVVELVNAMERVV